MGTVYTEITLINPEDEFEAHLGLRKPQDIRSATVQAVADTGALYPVITEELCQRLGLTMDGERTALIANGVRVKSKFIPAVKVRWKDRDAIVQAIVIPGSEKILFGAMALEGMDLMVDPVSQQVVGAHGDTIEVFAL